MDEDLLRVSALNPDEALARLRNPRSTDAIDRELVRQGLQKAPEHFDASWDPVRRELDL